MSYRITREIRPDGDAIIFEFDQDSKAELFRDFSQLQRLHKYAWPSSVVGHGVVSPPIDRKE